MIKDLEDAYERFAIMTVDGGITDLEALVYIKNRYSERIMKMIVEEIYKDKKTGD